MVFNQAPGPVLISNFSCSSSYCFHGAIDFVKNCVTPNAHSSIYFLKR